MEVVKHQKFNKWLRSSLKQTPAQYYQSKNYSFTGNGNNEDYMSSEDSLNRNIRSGRGAAAGRSHLQISFLGLGVSVLPEFWAIGLYLLDVLSI